MPPVYVRCSRIANGDVKNFWQRLSQFGACFRDAPLKPSPGLQGKRASKRRATEVPQKKDDSRLGRDTTRAGEGTRTLDIQLGKLALYQLSYARRKREFSRFLVRHCPVEFIQHPHKTLAERPKSKSGQIWAKELGQRSGQRKSKKRYDEGPARSSNRPRTRKLYRRPVP